MDNIQEQNDELLSFDPSTPKWLSIAFKFYGAFALITGIFGIAMILVLSNFESSTFLISVSLIILGTALSSFILAYGCWKLKRWVIPILALTAISGLLSFFQDSSIQSISSSIISIIFFVIAIYYRSYFTGLYRSYAMQGLYILGLILIIAASILPIFTDGLEIAKTEVKSAYTLHDIRQYSLGLELYYSDNNKYPENLDVLKASGYVLSSINSVSDTDEKIDYCVRYDKKNYVLGASILDSSGNIMKESAKQVNLPCKLSFDNICGENGYYCEVRPTTVISEETKSIMLPLPSSDPHVTADIKEIGMTFEYPNWWGDFKYRIGPDPIEFDYEGSRLDIWFSNYDRVNLTGLSADYKSTSYNGISNFSGFTHSNLFLFFQSPFCNDFILSEKEAGTVFKNLLYCEEINVDRNNIKAVDYFLTYNWMEEFDKEFGPALYRIAEFDVPKNDYDIGGLRLVFNLDTNPYARLDLIKELKLTIEKPEILIENKEKMLEFYEDIVYGLQLEVADKSLLQLNNELTDLISSIKFR